MWSQYALVSLLTFFDDVLEIRHALNVCPGDVLVLTEDGLDFGTEFLEHVRISYKKTAAWFA